MSYIKKINYKERNQIQDFESGTMFYFQNILKKIYGMIVFRNLPESINETFLKQTLFLQGKIAFFENEGELLALNCQYSDVPNVYYIPEKIIIANPVIGSKNLKINDECILVYCSETDIYNFSGMYGGLYYLIMRTAQQLADCDISINCYLKNTRVFKLVAADDEITKNSALIALQKMYDGETVAVADNNLISKIQSIDMFGGNSSAQISNSLIEMKQYILAHFYHEIGLNTNDNMKRAHLLETEVNTNTNLVRANIQNIIETIAKGIEAVNEKFGTEIEIELSDIYRNADAEEISNDILTDDNITESNNDLNGADPEPEEPAEGQTEEQPEEEPEEDQTEEQPEEEPEEDQTEEQPEEEPAEDQTEEQPEEEPAEDQTEEQPEEEPEEEPEPKPEQLEAAAEALEKVLDILIEEKEGEEDDKS